MPPNYAKVSLLAVCLFLAGCVTQRIDEFDLDKLRKIEVSMLAQDYGRLRRNAEHAAVRGRAALEIESRAMHIPSPAALLQLETMLLEKGLPKAELEAAKQGKIFIGMSVLGLYAARGKPLKENRTVTASGSSIQHVYGNLGPYVYSENGTVTSWQD